MKSKIISVIPTYNSEEFLEKTLESLARQKLPPDRVIIADDCSTDRTEEIARNFKGVKCEFIPNARNLGLFQNFNRCLDFAVETEFLHFLPADDTVEPDFFKVMSGLLADCDGCGQAWCLDGRIDEQDRALSISGKADGGIEVLSRDEFLRLKAEIRNQACGATLLKTNFQPSPCKFPLDFPILGDVIFWAAFGAHCRKIVHIHEPLAKYRWHGSNQTMVLAPGIKPLILDEWRTMEINEALRGKGWSLHRKLKLKGMLAVRSGIKAKRVRQNGNSKYSHEITLAARQITGWPLWLAAKFLVELRDLAIYKIGGRTRHPKNIYG